MYTNGLHCFCFVYFEIIQTQNRRLNSEYMQKSSLQSYQTQIKTQLRDTVHSTKEALISLPSAHVEEN